MYMYCCTIVNLALTSIIKNFGVYFDHFHFTTISYNMWPSILIVICAYDKVNKIENFYVEMNR